MSVENEARPHGPSKVSRRNLIAGAAVAVPAAAVLNASSAWAKPVVNSLIGMPALVASVQYNFTQLFSLTMRSAPDLNKEQNRLTARYSLKNVVSPGETLTVTSAVASVKKGANAAFTVNVVPGPPGKWPFTIGPGNSKNLDFQIASVPVGVLTAGAYSVTLTLNASGGVPKTVSTFFEVEF